MEDTNVAAGLILDGRRPVVATLLAIDLAFFEDGFLTGPPRAQSRTS